MARVGRLLVAALGAVLVVPALSVATVDDYRPGASGAGDRYFPRDGNGGYDVRRYGLDLRYRPATDRLTGTATIRAVATQPLSRFHLDLDAMTVRSVRVDGRRARWEHRRGELVVDPAGPGLRRGKRFVVTVRYGGVPRAIHDVYGTSGFFHTSDGLLIAGQPKVASTWFPVNDHPTDTAPFTFAITAPARLQVVANGVLRRTVQQGRQRTWHWVANDPMAPYLATVAVGRFDLRSYRRDGIRYWDAIDPATRKAVARPRSGTRFAIGGQANQGYKRLTRVVDVPAEGATVSFRTRYDVEDGWDFWFVEARPVGGDRWTTLRDRNGHTDRWPGFNCLGLLELHPFLRHYLARTETGGCRARGTTGQWHAATGRSRGYEPWSVSLDRYAGQTVELSLTHVTDGIFPVHGVFVDDVSVSTGEGSTSFEADDDPWDGWTVPGPPASSPGNTDDWKAGTATDAPPSFGEVGSRSLRKQPAMISFLSRRFGPYPFEAAGGIVDHEPRLLFALENQTRPVYPRTFLYYQLDSDLTVVHELAHQWYGNSLTLRRWRHIWLNEGFATYAEWLWLERQGIRTARQTFRDTVDAFPAQDPFWRLDLVDPGRDALFDLAVYYRGAMVLQALRNRVGDETFFQILRRWARTRSGETVTTGDLIALAERVSGEDLDRVFRRWLFAQRKPRTTWSPRVTAGTDRTSGPVAAFSPHHLPPRR